MNIAICDDNTAFLQDFTIQIEHICSLKGWQVTCKTFSSSHALLSSDLSRVELLFLDIKMPGTDGITAAQKIRSSYPNLLIVFVTAFLEYATEGYEVGAFRYLLKQKLNTTLRPCLEAAHEKLLSASGAIYVQLDGAQKEILLQNIVYLEGTSHRKVILHLTSPEELECTGKLSDFENFLSPKGFLRLQKSYLANMNHILTIRGYQAILDGYEPLKVSERQYSEVCRKFMKWKGLRPVR